MKQHTLGGSFTLRSIGLHTGKMVTLTLKPAEENTGYVIRRTDLEGENLMPATADYVAATQRGTVLRKGDCVVSTVEHCLSALYALGVDNCLMEVDGPEFPILDGSAAYYVQNIRKVGIVEQEAEREEMIITEPVEFAQGGSKITLLPADHYRVELHVGYESSVLASQEALLEHLEDYEEQISHCRTFVFVREILPLLAAGLIKGGDLQNAIVIHDCPIPEEHLEKLESLCKDNKQVLKEYGYINGPLKFENEPARHKLLDIVGDLALIGKRIRGTVRAEHPGHGVNTACAAYVRKEYLKG